MWVYFLNSFLLEQLSTYMNGCNLVCNEIIKKAGHFKKGVLVMLGREKVSFTVHCFHIYFSNLRWKESIPIWKKKKRGLWWFESIAILGWQVEIRTVLIEVEMSIGTYPTYSIKRRNEKRGIIIGSPGTSHRMCCSKRVHTIQFMARSHCFPPAKSMWTGLFTFPI